MADQLETVRAEMKDPVPKMPPPPPDHSPGGSTQAPAEPVPPPPPSSEPQPLGGGVQAPDRSLELAILQLDDSPEIVLPLTGQLVNLRQPLQTAQALRDVRDLKRQLDEVKMLLEGALRIEAARQGTKTLHLGPVDAVISGGRAADYDAELLQERLRQVGLPEERIAEVVVQTVSYKVNQRVLKHITGANPDYAVAADAARTIIDTPWYVTLKPVRGGKR
jgi:hypothetical protein